MSELVLLGAAAISIEVMASVYNKRRFAPVPAQVRKCQPEFRLGQRPIDPPPPV